MKLCAGVIAFGDVEGAAAVHQCDAGGAQSGSVDHVDGVFPEAFQFYMREWRFGGYIDGNKSYKCLVLFGGDK